MFWNLLKIHSKNNLKKKRSDILTIIRFLGSVCKKTTTTTKFSYARWIEKEKNSCLYDTSLNCHSWLWFYLYYYINNNCIIIIIIILVLLIQYTKNRIAIEAKYVHEKKNFFVK